MCGARNWEQGFELDRCIDSALRHLNQWIDEDRDEDHLTQALWNLCAFIHFKWAISKGILSADLDDVPKYTAAPVSLEQSNYEEIKKAIGVNVNG